MTSCRPLFFLLLLKIEKQTQPESKFKQAKPDTVFKEVTGKMAVAVGLDLLRVYYLQ
jgi:hypothetical protein